MAKQFSPSVRLSLLILGVCFIVGGVYALMGLRAVLSFDAAVVLMMVGSLLIAVNAEYRVLASVAWALLVLPLGLLEIVDRLESAGHIGGGHYSADSSIAYGLFLPSLPFIGIGLLGSIALAIHGILSICSERKSGVS